MLIKPPESITESLGCTVAEAKARPRGTCLNDPAIAARVLTTKEDLALYYPATPDREATAVVIQNQKVATPVQVARAITVAPIVGAKGGKSIQASQDLSALPAGEVSAMSIEELVKARKTTL